MLKPCIATISLFR